MPNITKLKGTRPGKTIAIFSGIHGNEKAGIFAIRQLKKSLKIERGTVYLVEANLPAIKLNTRLVNKNLNRCFVRGNPIETYEDRIADKLMDLLDTCDALLDLHSYNDRTDNRTVFAICEEDTFGVAHQLDVLNVVAGFTKTQEGSTDGYMNRRGKTGVCVELGSVTISKEMSSIGVRIAKQFLGYFGVISVSDTTTTDKTFFQLTTMYRRNADRFSFTKKLKTFDIIPANTTFATDGDLSLSTEHRSRILFPSIQNPKGVEAFILVKDLKSIVRPAPVSSV